MTIEEVIAILNEQLIGQTGEVILANIFGQEQNSQNVGEFIQAEYVSNDIFLIFSGALVIFVSAFGSWILSVDGNINENSFSITGFCQSVIIGGETIENIVENIFSYGA